MSINENEKSLLNVSDKINLKINSYNNLIKKNNVKNNIIKII